MNDILNKFEDLSGDEQATEFLRPHTGSKNAITTLIVEYLKHDKHFENDKETRDIYKVTLERAGRSYSFNFGQSLQASGKWAAFSHKKPNGRIFPNSVRLTGAWGKAFKYLENANRTSRTEVTPPFRDKPEIVKIKRNLDLKKPSEYAILAALTTNDPGRFEDFCGDFGYDEDSRTAERIYNAVCDEFLNLERLFTPAQMEQLSQIQ